VQSPGRTTAFQFRGAIGGGYLSDREKVDAPAVLAPSGFGATISGAAGAFELYFGGVWTTHGSGGLDDGRVAA
jgi:hypothetical protein